MTESDIIDTVKPSARMLIPFKLIRIAKDNPHIDWNEQMDRAINAISDERLAEELAKGEPQP